jgi:hypothetical protein
LPLNDDLRFEILALNTCIASEREEWARGMELAQQALAVLPPECLRLRAI